MLSAVIGPTRPLGVDKELSARWLVPLMQTGAARAFVLASDAVDDARAIKDAREQELMRAASAQTTSPWHGSSSRFVPALPSLRSPRAPWHVTGAGRPGPFVLRPS